MDSKYGCNINSGQLDTSRYSSPMPIIGLYIALASLACLAFASIDIFTGFKALGKRPRQKFWFSCKWFGTNAATLTLLSVATKLPVDLNTAMPGPHHQLTKLSGTVMLSVATAFFLPSFGNKNVEDMISNLVALAILIITVAVNIGIQMGTGVIFTFLPEHIFVICSMLFITVNVFIAAMTSEGVKDALGKSFKKVENGCTTVLENLRDTKTDSVGKIEEGMELCKEGSVWLVLALQTLFVVLTTIPIVFRWFESIRFVHHPWFEIIRFVHHPIREMRSWSRLLTIELKRSKLSYTLVTEKVEDSFFGGATGAWIERFFRGIGMIFLSLQPLASLSSRMISRSSSALIFWLFKRVDPEKEEPLKHAVVHLEDEKDFHDWMCAWHKNDVDKEMAVLSLPSTTNPPLHGTEDDIHRLTKLLHEFNPDTSLEVDPFSGLLQKITESRECKCIDTVLGMEAIAEKLGKVEVKVDRIESYCCDWMVKGEYLERSLHPDTEGAKQLLRYIDEYGLEKTPDSSDASKDSYWQSFEGPDEPIKTYQLVWFFTKQSKWYSPAVYVFLHELLDSVERKLGNRELPVDEVGQYMRSQCRPQVARLILSILTHIFVAAYNAISPSKTKTFEDDIGEEVVRKTLAILHLLGQLKEPLFAQLEKCYRNSSCTLREVVISNKRSISSISLHPWEEHKFFTRPYKPPFPILDELFRKKFCQRSDCSFGQRSDCSFRMFGVALACITHQLAGQLDGATESGASTKTFIRSLEGYWGILYYIDAVANFHNELWEPQLPIKLANVDVLLKWLLQDVEPPSSSIRIDGTAETFQRCIIDQIKNWAATVSERLDHNQETLLSEIGYAIHEDIKARREKGENCNLTTMVDDLKKQILLVIFSALLRVFPAIHGHIFNLVDRDIHALPTLPNETDRSALIGEQEHVKQSTWFRNTQDILQILKEGDLLAYLAAFYRRSLTEG